MPLFPNMIDHPLCQLAGVRGLVFMTDEAVTGTLAACLPKLPKGTLVVFREYDHPDRRAYATEITKLCRTLDLKIFIAGDVALAKSCKADGVHLPEYLAQKTLKSDLEGLSVSMACHSLDSLSLAADLSVDLAIVSPVFNTKSHPDTLGIGVDMLQKFITQSSVEVAALGGINHETAPLLKGVGIAAIAGIRGLLDSE